MKRYAIFFISIVLIISSCTPKANENSAAVKENSSEVEVETHILPGANVLAFGPDYELFIGDSRKATIYVVPTDTAVVTHSVPFNLRSIDRKIAAKLGIHSTDLIIGDMKIHPANQNAYLAVKRGHEPDAPSLIVVVNPTDESIEFLDVSEADNNKVTLENPVNPDYNFWKHIPASNLNITDIDYHDGFLYVAGVTNGEFASNLRKIAYPFNGKQTKVAGIEMWHAVHTQNETRAPIRTMLFEDLDGVSTLIASYTCTPLVTIPTDQIKEGNHIKAKTIAELGYGNAPIDMVTFLAQEPDGSYDKKLLVVNKKRSGSVMSLKDIETANQGKGLAGTTTVVPSGLNIFPVGLANTMQVDNQNEMMLTLLERNLDTGSADLVSMVKGAYFRLSDFVSEYNFPDYRYSEEQLKTKGFQDMLKGLEGYATTPDSEVQ